MHFFTTFLSAGLVSATLAAYTVQDDYSGNNFFGMFGYDTVGPYVSFSSILLTNALGERSYQWLRELRG